MNSMESDTNKKVAQLNESKPIAEKLAYSLGDEFHVEYENFRLELQNYLQYHLHSPIFKFDEVLDLEARVSKSAAKLHNILREKLISIRDTKA